MATKLILLIAVCVSFGAGLLIGMESRSSNVAPANPVVVTTQPAATAPTTRGDRMQSYLSTQLALTADQQAQMKQIWESSMRDGMRQHDEKRRQLRKQREEAIVALIAPEQKSEYEAVLQRYTEGNANLEKEMRGNFERAVDETKKILNPEQRLKYEKMLEDRQKQGGPWDRGLRRDRDEQNPSSTIGSTTGSTIGSTIGPAADNATTRP